MEAWNEEQAEAEFVRGKETYPALAKRWGVEENFVRQLGRAQGWYKKRLEYRRTQKEEAEPLDILRLAALRLCRCAGQVAEALDSGDAPAGKGDLKALHDAAALLKDLTGLVQNLYGNKEEKMEEVIFRMEGELDGFCD